MASDYDPDENDVRGESISKTTRRGLLGALGVAGLASLGSSGASANLSGGPEADAMAEYRVPTYRVPESDLDSPGVVGRRVEITAGGSNWSAGDQLVDTGSSWERVSAGYESVSADYGAIERNQRQDHPQRGSNSWRLPVGDNWTKHSENPFDGLIGTASWNEGGVADPWSIRPSFDRDTIYLFIEVFNSDESKRQIGVASASVDSPFDLGYGSYTNPVDFSDDSTTTSWPFVFEYGGIPYMIRGSSLYKTSQSDFPGGEWTKVWDFPIDMADLSLVQKNGVWVGVGSRKRTNAAGNDRHVQQVVIGTDLEDESTFRTHPQRYIPPHRNKKQGGTKSGMLHKFGENLIMYYQYENGKSIGCAAFDDVGPQSWALTRYDSPILGDQTSEWDRKAHQLSVVRVDDTYYGYYDGKDPFGDDMWRVGGVTMGAVV